MIIMKFGGSSLATAAGIRQVADLIVNTESTPCVVLSAMGNTTTMLFEVAAGAGAGDSKAALVIIDKIFTDTEAVIDDLFEDATRVTAPLAQLRADAELLVRGIARAAERGPSTTTARTTDALVAHGERISTLVLTELLLERGHKVMAVDARDVIRTNAAYGKAKPIPGQILQRAHQNIGPHLAHGTAIVTQGYVGSAPDGSTTTLGRGASDWTAALLCAALAGDELQIWTDVEGVLTADPRIVSGAQPIPDLEPEEAAELAAFGARVLHPATMQPCVAKGIPVTVRHTMHPKSSFTRIKRLNTASEKRGIVALASRGPITVLTMTSCRMLDASGYLAQLFEVFGELEISIDLVTTAEVSVSCTVEADAPVQKIIAALDGHAHVDITTNCAIVAAIGDGLQNTKRVIERACQVLYPIKPQMVSFGGNSRNLSFVVRQSEEEAAVRRLHDEFFGDSSRAPQASASFEDSQ